jgi:YhcN/YlaJ family sporulation lipoprotein
MGRTLNSLRMSVLMLTVCLSALPGCGNRQASPSPQDGRVQTQSTDTPGRSDATSTASHLEMLARSVRGVHDANCVVFGNYAIVGLDVDPAMDRGQVGTIKYAVAHALLKDPQGTNALVTADIDMAQRLREIRADVRRGRPVNGFAEELADIVGRVIPQAPRNGAPRRPAATNAGPHAHNG